MTINNATLMINDLINQVKSLDRIQEDPQFKSDAVQNFATDQQGVFASQGATIGRNWGTDLVDTGRLRNASTSVSTLRMTVVGNRLIIENPTPYAGYVDKAYGFMDVSPSGRQGILASIASYLRRARANR